MACSILFLFIALDSSAEPRRIQGPANILDSQLRAASPNNNYGATVTFSVQLSSYVSLLGMYNLRDSLGDGYRITAAFCSLFCSVNSDPGAIRCYKGLKPFYEGGGDNTPAGTNECSWNDWAAADSEWNTAGVGMAGDDSTYNHWDDNGADRKATDFARLDINGAGWYSFNIDTSIVNRWYNGESWPVAFISDSTDAINCSFRSSEHSSTSQRPIIWLTYEATSPSGARRRKSVTSSIFDE